MESAVTLSQLEEEVWGDGCSRGQAIEGAYHKKALAPSERRESVSFLVAEKGLSVVKACAAVDLSRSAWYRKPQDKLERDREIIDALQYLVEKKPRWGLYLCYQRLRLDGHIWNHKRVYRVYRELGLNIRRKTKKRLPGRDPLPMEVPNSPNAIWSLDFMSDSLYFGK